MNRYKRHVIAAIGLAMLPLVIMACVTLTIDPYNLFHRQPFARPRYYQTTADTERQRLHAFGMIYSYVADPACGYDAILVGSSRTAGMSSSRIAEKLKVGRVANLSLIGGRGVENRVLVERALATKRIKTVLWEVDYWFIDSRKPPGHIPPYLWTANRIDDLRYLLTPYVFLDSIDLLTGRHAENWTDDEDTLNSPMKHLTRAGFELRSTRIARSLKPIPRQTEYSPQAKREFRRLDEDMIAVIRRYPDVNFYLFFPVVPNLLYASQDPQWSASFVAGRRYLVEQFSGRENVRIFAFDTDARVVGNLANFLDANHFGHGLDAYLLDCFASGANELTTSTITGYEQRFIERIDHCTIFHDASLAEGYDPRFEKAN